MIREAIDALVAGQSLSIDQAAQTMDEIMDGEATPAQFGAFVTALRLKGETPEEIAGMARVMREKSLHVHVEGSLVDTAGTGADASNSFNISTTAGFVLAGAGPLRPALEDRARKMGVSGAVEFLGVRDDIPRLMRRSSVFVRPSSLEGMPLTVLEAMASGLPVVATPAGGTPELLEDGKDGFLFPVGDHGALAHSITRLLDDRDFAAEMGRHGRRTVEDGYTWDQVVERTEEVYRRAVSR